MSKKVYLRTFGCQMNEYDSDKMVDILHASYGMMAAESAEEADVILFNTCSVREKAQAKVFSDLGQLRAHQAEHQHPQGFEQQGQGVLAVQVVATREVDQHRRGGCAQHEGHQATQGAEGLLQGLPGGAAASLGQMGAGAAQANAPLMAALSAYGKGTEATIPSESDQRRPW